MKVKKRVSFELEKEKELAIGRGAVERELRRQRL